MQQLVVISAKEDDTMPTGVFEARTFLLWGSSANHCATTLAQLNSVLSTTVAPRHFIL